MRRACIDIGTNTVRLLVADVHDEAPRLVPVRTERASSGLVPDAPIGEEAARRLASIVAAQARLAVEHGAPAPLLLATAALRRAPDGDEVARRLADAAGSPCRTLSPAGEARLAFAGAVGSLRTAPSGVLAVVDVGGGSTEIAVGEAATGASWTASAPLGSAVLEATLGGDPPTPQALEGARTAAREALAGAAPDPPAVGAGLAVGGSAQSLRRVLDAVEVGPLLDAPGCAAARAALTAQPAAAAARRFAIEPRRARLLPAALCLLEAAADRLGVALALAQGGVREGALLVADALGE